VVLVRTPNSASAATSRSRLARVGQALRSQREVTRVLPARRSDDGNSAYVAAFLRNGSAERDELVAARLEQELAMIGGAQLGGPVATILQLREQVTEDLKRAELIAFPLLLLAAFFVFRGLIAGADADRRRRADRGRHPARPAAAG
jgi:RND superfamily putative drug exporter